jgi:hypothetical protein
VKEQQRGCTERGAHLLLQVRTRVLDDTWRSMLWRWCPSMHVGYTRVEAGLALGFSWSRDGVVARRQLERLNNEANAASTALTPAGGVNNKRESLGGDPQFTPQSPLQKMDKAELRKK